MYNYLPTKNKRGSKRTPRPIMYIVLLNLGMAKRLKAALAGRSQMVAQCAQYSQPQILTQTL
jgi:hypothetical protein